MAAFRTSIFLWLPLIVLINLPLLAGLGAFFTKAGLLAFDKSAGSHLWMLAEVPGLSRSFAISLAVAFISAFLSLELALLICALRKKSFLCRIYLRFCPVLIAIPHIAIAFAVVFLWSPSGWVMRLFSPWATGFVRPPVDAAFSGLELLALICALVVKETPFLALILSTQLKEMNEEQQMRSATALGYASFEAWMKVIRPQIQKKTRLALYAVLIYSFSNVEMALIAGPSSPPLLPVLTLEYLLHADEIRRVTGLHLALLIMAGSLILPFLWMGAERFYSWFLKTRLLAGRGSKGSFLAGMVARHMIWLLAIVNMAALSIILLWSVAEQWRFPDSFPKSLSLERFTSNALSLFDVTWTTSWTAIAFTAICLVLIVLYLEGMRKHKGVIAYWFYIPLIVPQLPLFYGIQMIFIRLDIDGSLLAVAWAQSLYIVPYMLLVLRDPFLGLDPRFAQTAGSFGYHPLRVLIFVKLPLLLPSVSLACAVGFAVSVALYLPTLFGGAGRVETLATEAMALSHAGDRRLAASLALLMALLPMMVFWLSMYCSKNRKRPA